MEIWELFLVAVSLSMDAFAVSVCKGLSVKKLRPRHCATAGLYFGGFQALMPLLGWLLGRQFESLIKSIDHWIAFVLLALIGANMIREALGDEEDVNDSFSFKTMLPLAVATSIDALAVGVTFAFLEVQILPAILLIGCTTFALRRRRQNRQRLRLRLAVQSRDCRRRHPDTARHKDSDRAFVFRRVKHECLIHNS